MHNPLCSITQLISRRLGRIITAGALVVMVGTATAATNTPVSLSATLSNTPAGTRLVLSWPSQPGAKYILQNRTSLSPANPWQDFDLYQPTGATFNVTLDGDPLKEEAHFREATGFYRLLLPEQEIFRIEPSVAPAAGGTTLYLLGQCLSTNGSVRIGGLVIPPNVLQPGSLYSFTAPALPEGVYDVEWLEGGQVVARKYKLYSVTGQPSPVGEARGRLLEPPVEPPATPRFTEVTGLDVYIDALEIQEGGVNTGAHKRPGARIRPASAELQFTEADLQIPGRGLDFVFQRTYRSRTAPPDSTMGVGWTHSYEIRVGNWNDASGHFDLWDGSGRIDRFFRGTNGIYSRDEFFCEGSVSNNTFTLTFPDSGKWIFHPFDGSAQGGKIARIQDRKGNALLLHYDAQGRCAQIVDTLDRTNTLAYTPDGFVSAVADFTGRSVRYGYARVVNGVTPPGVLTAVTNPPVTGTPNGNDFPNGKIHRYTYTQGFADERLNRNLTSCIDGKGQTAWQITYRTNQDPASIAFDTVGLIQRGPYRTKLVRLPQTPTPQNRYAVVRCIENDGAGNVTEFFYDSLNRLVTQREFTGRASPDLPTTDTQNRPANKLRQDDPDYFENNWEWNLDSLCVRHLRPHPNVVLLTGRTTQFFYERDFNKSASLRKKGDLRVLRETACCGGADLDGDGTADFTERTVRFQHDSRFGSDLRPWIDSLTGSRLSLVHQELHRPSMALGFATSVTDARGGNTVCAYDPKGNLLEVRHPDPIGAENFEYNAFGQRTARLDFADGEGRRRRDENIYYSSGPQNGYLRHRIQDCLAAGFHQTNTFEYDARGNLIRLIDPRGFDTRWTYNALDQATARQTPNTSFGTLVRTTTLFTYDANDDLVQTDVENRDHTGTLNPTNTHWTTEYTYDSLGQLAMECIEIAHEGLKACTAYGYDANGNLVLKRSPEAVSGVDPNNVVTYQYDERNMLFQVLPAPGTGLATVDRYDYDAVGNCRRVSKIDSFTIKQTLYSFDGFGRQSQVVDALGNVAISGFDRNDNLVFERHLGETNDVPGSAGNRRLAESRYEYDGMNRLTRFRPSFFDIFTELSIGDGESTTTFAYAPNGQLRSEMDDNGHSTRFTYDSAGRRASMIDAKTNVVSYTYDGSDNVLAVVQSDRSDVTPGEQLFREDFFYDGRNRLVLASNNVGNTVSYGYNSRSLLTRQLDELGTLHGWEHDGLGHTILLEADLDGDGDFEPLSDLIVSQSWDGNSRLFSSTDANGNATTRAYDSLDRLVATTNADLTVESLVWSPRSKLASRTDANGTVTTFTHDLLDRCVRKDIAAAPTVATTTTFEEFHYDGLSRLVMATNNTSMLDFTYDSLGHCDKAKQDCLASTRTFDGEGNLLSVTYPGLEKATYTYNALDRVATVGREVGGVVSPLTTVAYEGADRVTRVARANGVNTRVNWSGLQNPPNAAGDFGWLQVARVNHARAQGGAVIDQRVFTYDQAQNKTLRAQTTAFSQGGPTTTNAFAYDKLHRLLRGKKSVGTVLAQDNQYTLDRNGNRQQVIANGAAQIYEMNPALPEPADFQMNQYSFTPFGGQQHDRNGNLVSVDGPAGATQYYYDYANRLVHVERAAGPALIPLASFSYDALGRRISKTTYPPAPAAPVTAQFVHDPYSEGDGILEIRSGGAVAALFHDEDGDVGVWVKNGVTRYLHKDDLGNVLALTDENGSILERYEYADFGTPSFLDAKGTLLLDGGGQPVSSSPAGNPFLFHGMFWDAETKLYLSTRDGTPVIEWTFEKGWSCRYISPETGQGTSRMKLDGGMPNRISMNVTARAFAGNNPWSGGGGGDGAGGMRAGISTSRSNLRNRSALVDDSSGGAETRAGISTSRSNLRNRSALVDDSSGGAETRAGISTSRSNLRSTMKTGDCRSKARAGYSSGGGEGEVMFNPKEYNVGKVTVRGWDPKQKHAIPGQSTPLRGHRDVGGYRLHGPGAAHWGISRPTVPRAMDKGLRFAIREGGRTVGAGQVIEIVK